ncbi:hypothetical protein [Marinicrinis lubricantis]|uniref:Small, acid-soluble spore protein gamma-type n=1 Tax=Marinicrinis lubricantis TaxID=2086470 RepID=A0ABW1ILL9_9BACL
MAKNNKNQNNQQQKYNAEFAEEVTAKNAAANANQASQKAEK